MAKAKKDRKKMGKKSRNKGQRGERKLAELFSKWWGTEFARTPSSGGFKTKKFREDWNAAADLVTPDPEFPFAVESKNCEGWHLEQLLTAPKCEILAWWKQTVDQCPPDKLPLLVFTRNHQPHFFMCQSKVINGLYSCAPFKDGLGPTLLNFSNGNEYHYTGLLSELFKTSPDEWKQYTTFQHKISCNISNCPVCVVKRNTDTEGGKEFWETVTQAAEIVENFPSYKRGCI